MDWSIVGIVPTKDKKAITAAYRARLKQTNPEEKPEEFKALRAAYEEAIRLADQEEQPTQRDESPVGIWKERLGALYADFAARLQPGNWKALLGDDVCVGLDTRPQVEEVLLQFLLENYFLPRNVWQVLDEVFDFSRRAEALCEEYPREFVENAILNGIRLEPALPYDLFKPGVSGPDCDTYRRLYHQTGQTPLEELGGLLDRMEALSEDHPYGRALRCRWQMDQGLRDEAVSGFRGLAKAYPDDEVLNLDWAAVCMEMGDQEEAEATVRHMLAATPDHIHAKRILGDCLAAKGQFDDAKELAFEIMHTAGDDPIIMDQCAQKLRQWNETMITKRQAAMDADPSDWDNAIELAWCYTQNERLEEALEIAESIDPGCPDQFGYHNLMGKLYHNMKRCAEALPHLEAAEALIRQMTPDGTDKTAKRMSRLPEMIQVQGNCLMQMGREEEARVKFEQALALAPEDPKLLTVYGQILYASGDYEGCVEIQERLLLASPGSWFANVILSLALQKLHRDREAFDAVNRAMSFQGGDLSMYVIKMQILLRNGVFDEVHAILDFLRDNNAPADLSTDWIKAQLTELEEKNEKKAFREYQALARRVEAGEDFLDAASLYYRMAVLMGKQMDNRKEDREILMTVLEKGLAQDKYHEDCLGYKAWLLQKDGKLEEAVDMYRSLRTPSAQLKLAELYYNDLSRYAAEALASYEALLLQRQSAELYFYAATCCRHMGDLERAMGYYKKELELDPTDVDGYNGVAYVLEAQGRYEEALEQVGQGIAVMWESENYFQWLVEHQAQILRRMGKYEQALAAIDDALARQNDPALWQIKFDTCIQFGLYDQAKQVIDQWQKACIGDPNQAVAAGRLHLLMGKMFKATLAMGRVKHKITYDQEQNFRLQLADLECNHKRKIQLLSRQCIPGPADSDTLASLALAQWWAGDRDSARGNAKRALEMIDETLEGHLVDEALFRSRRSVLLAILGREADARAELAAVRKLPLCQYCAYGRCKDADIYEAYIEEILGNNAQARKLYAAGWKNWPDELDFVSGENRMKKKGK